jgi:hypothetical protein
MAKRGSKCGAGSSVRERLERLASYLPVFEDPEFRFGMWVGGRPMPHQQLVTPGYVFSDPAERFLAMLHESGWVSADFEWRSWKNSKEAQALATGEQGLACASSDQLFQLLTALVRQEQSAEGTLANAFDSGLLRRIVRRARALRDEDTGGGTHPTPAAQSL